MTQAMSIEELIRQAKSLTEVVSYLMKGREWRGTEDAQLFLTQIQDQWNATPRPELLEHTPQEVAYLLYDLPQHEHVPLNDADLAPYENAIRESPLFHNWHCLLGYIHSTEVGSTATGNLNRKAITDLKERLKFPPKFTRLDLDWIHNEPDWSELYTLRYCAQFAGLLRQHKKTWQLTKKGSCLLARNQPVEIYITLLDVWFNQLDWRNEGRRMRSVLEPIQPYRYFILSALARVVVQPMLLSEFAGRFCYDYLRCPKEVDLFTLRLEIYYPLIETLERLSLVTVIRKKEGDDRFESPHTLQCTPLCVALVESIGYSG